MKKVFLTSAILAIAGVGLLAGSAMATSIDFDIAGGGSEGSSVSLTGVSYGSMLSVALAYDLDATVFTLVDDDSYTFDFLTFTASDDFSMGIFAIEAIMGFDLPTSTGPATASGDGFWIAAGASYGVGGLWWEDNTIDIVDSSDNDITITLAQGLTITAGSVVNLTATITNYGGGTALVVDGGPAPVPEPATMLLFGTGLVGLAGVARMKKAVLKK